MLKCYIFWHISAVLLIKESENNRKILYRFKPSTLRMYLPVRASVCAMSKAPSLVDETWHVMGQFVYVWLVCVILCTVPCIFWIWLLSTSVFDCLDRLFKMTYYVSSAMLCHSQSLRVLPCNVLTLLECIYHLCSWHIFLHSESKTFILCICVLFSVYQWRAGRRGLCSDERCC